ncbi:MAG TPA: helix-turn-helix transcriptional regulator [Acidimicrobiales bacterium]|nr:helix-turn-helix transcriptional regulator [Acidimicrobiales bacterium]
MPNQTAAEVQEKWAEKLRMERARRDLNQATVAEMAKVTAATISRAESGIGSLDTFLAIAAALGINLLGES